MTTDTPMTSDPIFELCCRLAFGFVVVLLAITFLRRTRIRSPSMAVLVSQGLCSIPVAIAALGLAFKFSNVGVLADPVWWAGNAGDFFGSWLMFTIVTHLALWFQKRDKIKSTFLAALAAMVICLFCIFILVGVFAFSCSLLEGR